MYLPYLCYCFQGVQGEEKKKKRCTPSVFSHPDPSMPTVDIEMTDYWQPKGMRDICTALVT